MGDASLHHLPKTLIFGANGKAARELTHVLRAAQPPHTVYGVIRNPDQIPDLEAIGCTPIVQDIATATEDDFVKIIESTRPDAVVWAAGGKDQKSAEAVDRDGAIRAINALARAVGVAKRYIVISALGVRDREHKPVPDWYSKEDRELSDRMYKFIGPILHAKFEADKELRVGNSSRHLNYTIVRPGGLSNESPDGKVRAGKVGVIGMLPRADLAGVIYAAMQNKKTYGLAFDVLGPKDDSLSIEDAVAKVADNHEDTFEGYY